MYNGFCPFPVGSLSLKTDQSWNKSHLQALLSVEQIPIPPTTDEDIGLAHVKLLLFDHFRPGRVAIHMVQLKAF